MGCRLWRLPPSQFRNDWSEVAEAIAASRKMVPVSYGAGKEEVKQDRVTGELLV